MYTCRNLSLNVLEVLLFLRKEVKQLLYNWFVNIRGMPRHNIPADLHMEHLNCAIKTAVSHSNAARIERSIIRVGKYIRWLNLAMNKFDETSSLSSPSGRKMSKIVSLLQSNRIF